jgi:hypothetical protein
MVISSFCLPCSQWIAFSWHTAKCSFAEANKVLGSMHRLSPVHWTYMTGSFYANKIGKHYLHNVKGLRSLKHFSMQFYIIEDICGEGTAYCRKTLALNNVKGPRLRKHARRNFTRGEDNTCCTVENCFHLTWKMNAVIVQDTQRSSSRARRYDHKYLLLSGWTEKHWENMMHHTPKHLVRTPAAPFWIQSTTTPLLSWK